MTWRDQIKKGIAALQAETQGGAAFETHVISAPMLTELIKRGDRGDLQARRFVMTITEWFALADQARKENTLPRCAACDTELDHGEVCGWLLFVPVEVGKTALCGTICENCIMLGEQVVADKAIALMAKSGSAEIMREH